MLESVGRYLLPPVADNGVCKVYASEKDMSKVWCSSACGHAFACKRRARCSDDCVPKKATKRRRAFDCEEVMEQRSEEDSL